MSKIKVAIVDDSALMRTMLARVLARDPDIEVVVTASDPLDARDKIREANPDVVTLDIEMPRMDGITFLEKIVTLKPMPVIMVSTLTHAGANATLHALELGAVDFIAKPQNPVETERLGDILIAKVKAAAHVRVRQLTKDQVDRIRAGHAGHDTHARRPAQVTAKPWRGPIVAIGASTGGVEALTEVLRNLPPSFPPVLVVQHMPEHFTAALAARLDRMCPPTIVEASDGMPVSDGHVYIAPGNRHLELSGAAGVWRCKLSDAPTESGHKPSVDVLFESVARLAKGNAVGAILTGMGRDGARGLKAMRDAGAHTVGQDQATSVVYGMPRVAFELGAVTEQVPLQRVAERLVSLVRKPAAA